MDIELAKKQLAEAAEEGYEKIRKEIWAAVKDCSEESLAEYAEKLVAAADVRAVLTGSISDELAILISKYDDPFPLLCDRLYMSREYSMDHYFNELENQIDSIIDPVSELEDSPELFAEGSAGQITGQRM